MSFSLRLPKRASPKCRISSWLLYSAAFLLLSATGSTQAQPASQPAATQPTLLLMIGAAGDDDFAKDFQQWADSWEQAAAKAGVKLIRLGARATNSPPANSDRLDLQHALEQEPAKSDQPLWLVLIGHGTFDGNAAKFNLRGPDCSADDLSNWLQRFERPLVLIHCFSCSGPFLKTLSAPGRIIITATRSGFEQNFSRFGQFFSRAISDPKSDLDQDGQISVLEAFVSASSSLAEFYSANGRLATEHPLLDDNGDGLGTPSDWFRGTQLIKKPDNNAAPDGLRARQIALILSPAEKNIPPAVRAQRDALELELADLRREKASQPEDEYYRKLEDLLLKIARLYHSSQPSLP